MFLLICCISALAAFRIFKVLVKRTFASKNFKYHFQPNTDQIFSWIRMKLHSTNIFYSYLNLLLTFLDLAELLSYQEKKKTGISEINLTCVSII